VSSRGPEKRIRKFGNVQLCGALHVCWQDTLQTARGECKIIVLYNGVLCIAVPTNNDKAYTVQACINVEELKVVGTYEGLGEWQDGGGDHAEGACDADETQDCSAAARLTRGRFCLRTAAGCMSCS
jgi:hypothetical protein